MRIAVVGAGGVGGYFGGKLANAGIDTTFFVRGATLKALRAKPLRVDSINGDFEVKVNTSPTGTFDVILITTKTYQLEEAAKQIVPFVGENTVVVPLQNGVDAADILGSIVGRDRVAAGLCAIVSFVVAPGHIKHAAAEPTVMFGELDNRRSERLERLREAFTRAGVRAEIPPDIHHSLWTKFVFIATLSAVGAITRVPIGVWRSKPEVREMVTNSLREVLAIATARGIDLGPDAIDRVWSHYDGLPAPSTSSLQRDVMAGKQSEVDAQIGAVVRMARELGIPAPVSETLYALLIPSRP
jgi:2-dehydropantoate 2-reductase